MNQNALATSEVQGSVSKDVLGGEGVGVGMMGRNLTEVSEEELLLLIDDDMLLIGQLAGTWAYPQSRGERYLPAVRIHLKSRYGFTESDVQWAIGMFKVRKPCEVRPVLLELAESVRANANRH